MKERNSRGWSGWDWVTALLFLVILFLGKLPCGISTQCGLIESNIERTTVENRLSECAIGVEWNFRGGDALITGDMDVYFLVDESSSVESANFEKTKQFATNILTQLYERGAIQEHNHVGFGQFSWNASLFFQDFVNMGKYTCLAAASMSTRPLPLINWVGLRLRLTLCLKFSVMVHECEHKCAR